MSKDNNIAQMARDPLAAAVLTKVTAPAASQNRGSRPDGGTTPLRTELSSIVSSRIRASRNSLRIYEALPEMETIVTIACSSMMSTKDLVNAALIYGCENLDLPLNVREILNECTREYFTDRRGLPKKAYRWTHEAMRWKGGNPVMIVSDSGFDETFGLRKVAGESAGRDRGVKERIQEELKRANKQQGILGSIKPPKTEGTLFERQMAAFESMIGQESRSTGDAPQPLDFDLKKGMGPLIQEFEKFFTDKQVSVKFNDRLTDSMSLSLTDNRDILKIPEMTRRVVQEASNSFKSASFNPAPYEGEAVEQTMSGVKPENVNLGRDRLKLTDLAPGSNNQPVDVKPYAEMPRLEFGQENRLDFTEIVLPAGSTIPVVMNGNTREPIGWLTLTDDMGNFVSEKSVMYGDINFYNYLTDAGQADSVVNRAYVGLGNSNVAPDIANRISSRFGELAEDYFTQAMSQAMGGVELDVNLTETFVKVLLTRHMAKRHTQVLYVPAENMAYFATHYDNDGFGVSLPERSFVISTVRMALLFAFMNASVLNAARFMQYDIELSPDDQNPQETIDRLKSDILNGFNRRMPTWGNMDDAWAMAGNANIAFNVTGNQHYSSHKVSVSDTTPEYKTPDMDFDNELLRRTARLACVDPDLVLNPENIEFASQIFSKSLIMTSQIQSAQEELSEPLTKYVKAGIKASPVLQATMLQKLASELGLDVQSGDNNEQLRKYSEYIQQYTASVKVTIPPPDTSAAASQMELFDKRIEFIDRIVDTIVNDGVLNQLNDSGLKFQADELKGMVRGYYITNWMRNQGMESDLIDLLTDKDLTADTVKAVSDQNRNVFNLMAGLSKRSDSKFETVREQKDLGESGDAGAGGTDIPTDPGTDGAGTDDLSGTGLDDADAGLEDGSGADNLGEEKDPLLDDTDAEGAPGDDDAAKKGGTGDELIPEANPDDDLNGVLPGDKA